MQTSDLSRARSLVSRRFLERTVFRVLSDDQQHVESRTRSPQPKMANHGKPRQDDGGEGLEPLELGQGASACAKSRAHAAGFAVTEEDLLAASGEPLEVLEVIEILATPQDRPQAELDAFLQQVELDPDLQRVLASAPDAEAVAALARVAGNVPTFDLKVAQRRLPGINRNVNAAAASTVAAIWAAARHMRLTTHR